MRRAWPHSNGVAGLAALRAVVDAATWTPRTSVDLGNTLTLSGDGRPKLRAYH